MLVAAIPDAAHISSKHFPLSRLRMAVDALQAGRLHEAWSVASDLYRESPDHPAVSAIIGAYCERLNRFSDAADWFRKAIELGSEDPVVWNNAAMAEFLRGRRDVATHIWQQAGERWPEHSALASMRLCTMLSDPRRSPASIALQHLSWAASYPDPRPPELHRSYPRLRLKIGYVSACFRRHSVMSFFRPVLEHHDRTKYEIYCYSSARIEDETTEWTRRNADVWRSARQMSDSELDRQIRSDEINILVDLDGHFESNRLPVFARRPSPISATYLGYPFTTGLPQIDYRLTDRCVDPEGRGDAWHSERLERLSRPFLCFDPKPACELSVEYNGASCVTFGCFSHFPKLNDRLLRLWKVLLERTPDSKLILKSSSLSDPRLRLDLQRRLRRLGFDVRRVEMREFAPSLRDHLEQYQSVDIVLDTFPYHGTTTTCEALTMGTPVVTRAGNAHYSRVGCTILQAIGHTEWIARNDAEYVDIAAQLASDETLRRQRAGLRATVASSALCDARGFVATLEHTYERWWIDSHRNIS